MGSAGRAQPAKPDTGLIGRRLNCSDPVFSVGYGEAAELYDLRPERAPQISSRTP